MEPAPLEAADAVLEDADASLEAADDQHHAVPLSHQPLLPQAEHVHLSHQPLLPQDEHSLCRSYFSFNNLFKFSLITHPNQNENEKVTKYLSK